HPDAGSGARVRHDGPPYAGRSRRRDDGMSRQRARIVLQAHATRSRVALALLLHGRARGPRELTGPWGVLIGSVLLAVVSVVAVLVATRVGVLLEQRNR